MSEEFETNNSEEKKSGDSCKCKGKEKSSGSCKGGCSCGSNEFKKASQDIVNLLKPDLL